ncbi:MAG TPA: adenylate/guanylate cyclase domain-containing protein, partial [Candidatus Limnocylindria bacterium]|nr:adenylate/guanylate cyclase domain-containing protein [Candidatus Limnocylindria bacterium]
MVCTACGAANRDGVKFCEECGASLERACPRCGARVGAGKKFCGECGTALSDPAGERFASPHAYTPPHLAERILKERSALAGERKQVTVLFADVAGFTSMSERLDPEDVHGLINGGFEVMLAGIHRFEGTVNQFLGDGLMALFGAPVAHEDHPQRAAHAALAMQAALAVYRERLRRERGVDFRVRMGLNTGLVVVAAIGDNLRMDYTAVGDITNTAARMQQLAEPGQIVIAEATERLIAPYFELQALGTFTVKNREQPVAAYALGRARRRVSRLAARAAQGLAPFVGRDDALASLEGAWTAVQGGRGQLALVVGDAGIGKSRLLLELRREVGDTATWIEGACISFGQSIPFLPIADMLRRAFAIGDADGEAEVIANVQRGIAVMGPDAAAAEPYLRYLLAADPGDPAVPAMDPGQRRDRIVGAIQRLAAAGSRRRPLVLVVEDAHWIDPASEDFLTGLADVLPGMPVLLVVTYRPLYRQPFGDRTNQWRVALQPVGDDEALGIVRATLGVADLPAELAATIAAKAEGNPFFLEEIGRALVETGAVHTREGTLVLSRPASAITVPETVQDVIAARLDRLDEAQKRTVQTAAVIGREFALGLLRRVSHAHERLEQSLTELKRIELIYERIGAADLEYVFRHALTQDVAYASLLQMERRRLHALIGRALEEIHAGRLEERAEELVHHFTRGEVWERVVPHAREAAEHAAALCVDDKAVEFYEAALGALGHLPETVETARAGIEIRFAMRAPLWRGGHPDRLFALYKEAEALAARHGLHEPLDSIYAFLLQYHWARGEPDLALDYGQRCLASAAERKDVGLRVTALFYLGHVHSAIGRHTESLRHYSDVMSILDAGLRHERFGLSGLPYSGACALAAECLLDLGDTTAALEHVRRGAEVAREAGHLYSQMAVAGFHGMVLAHTGAVPEAIALLEDALKTSRDKRFVGQTVNILRHLGD